MSTRCNVILKDGADHLFFYRHSDGYPEGTVPALQKFLRWLKQGKIRNNVSQSAGWLIMIDALEYGTIPRYNGEKTEEHLKSLPDLDLDNTEDPKDWKVGAFEPTTGVHGDIEHLYIIDLEKKIIQEVRCPRRGGAAWKKMPVIQEWHNENDPIENIK